MDMGSMGGKSWMLVYVMTTIASTSQLLLSVVTTQYVYYKVAQMHNATSAVTEGCGNSNTTELDHLISQEVSEWTLGFDMTLLLPAILAGIVITSLGDKVGRKISMTIPSIGILISDVYLAACIYLDWDLKYLYIFFLMLGFSGFYMTLLMQGYAFLSDVTPEHKRGIRMVILDTCIGIGGGVAGLVSGYWIQAQGFFVPVASCVILMVVSTSVIPLMPDSRKIRELRERESSEEKERKERERSGSNEDERSNNNCADGKDLAEEDPSLVEIKGRFKFLDLFKSVWRVYSSEYSSCDKCCVTLSADSSVTVENDVITGICPHGGGRHPGRVWRIWFYLASYCFLMYVYVGTAEFQTIYFLSRPLCFTPVLIGVQSGFKFFLIAIAPVFVKLYQNVFKFSNNFIIIIGFAGWLFYVALMAFATQVYVVFLATAVVSVATATKPFIQAQMSNLVSESEHGSAFALLSSFELFSFLIASISFLTIYSSTLNIFHGFAWLYAAITLVIPLALMSTIWICDQRKMALLESKQELSSQDGEREPLLT